MCERESDTHKCLLSDVFIVCCAALSQDEDDTLEKNEVLEKKDPTHYSKLDPKALKVFDQYFLP